MAKKNAPRVNEVTDKNEMKRSDDDKCHSIISKINVDIRPTTTKNSPVSAKAAGERVIE